MVNMKTQKKTFIKLTAMSALILLCLSPLSAQSKSTKLAHQTEDKNAPIVYFTRDVSAAGLMKVYKALNQKKQGKVGIKVSFGGPDEDVLKPRKFFCCVSLKRKFCVKGIMPPG